MIINPVEQTSSMSCCLTEVVKNNGNWKKWVWGAGNVWTGIILYSDEEFRVKKR